MCLWLEVILATYPTLSKSSTGESLALVEQGEKSVGRAATITPSGCARRIKLWHSSVCRGIDCLRPFLVQHPLNFWTLSG